MTKNAETYQKVTDRFIEALEKGVVPWQMPWAMTRDANPVTGTVYKGINILLLGIAKWDAADRGEEYGHLWSTYNGWKKLGGQIRKGEKSTTICMWDVWNKPTGETDENGNPVKEAIYLFKTYSVFNVAQQDGATLPAKYVTERKEHDVVDGEAEAEAIIAGYPNPPKECVDGMAWYRPSADLVGIPARESFHTPEDFWATRFHEYVHSTGHDSRLKRGLSNGFASEAYAKEELVAEMGAGFLLARVGMLDATFDNDAAYIGHWVKALKDDPKIVVQAASAAEKAVEYIVPTVSTAKVEQAA